MNWAKNTIVALITTPIWFYLVYWILDKLNAGELQWFLFYTYIPFQFIIILLSLMVTEKKVP